MVAKILYTQNHDRVEDKIRTLLRKMGNVNATKSTGQNKTKQVYFISLVTKTCYVRTQRPVFKRVKSRDLFGLSSSKKKVTAVIPLQQNGRDQFTTLRIAAERVMLFRNREM